MIRRLFTLCLLALLVRLALTPALGEVVTHAAPDGSAGRQLVIYSTLDNRLATPLIAAFAVGLMHRAGVPASALHLLPGDGAVGAMLRPEALLAAVRDAA